MILFGSELYLTGALSSAYIYKSTMTRKQRSTIDLICIVENTLYDMYKDILLKVFDKVYSITMDYIHLSDEYKHRLEKAGKYTPRLASSYTNKWQSFGIVEYEKILFMDMDIVPMNSKFFNVFELPTPAAMINPYPKPFTKYPEEVSSDEWFTKPITKTLSAHNIKHSINGGIFLFSPSKELAGSYFRFLKAMQKPKGYSSLTGSFPDETSLILYFAGFLRKKIHIIPDFYSKAGWESDKSRALSINYLYAIKPWNIPPQMLYGSSDLLWIDALNALMEKVVKLKFLKLIHAHNQLYTMYKKYGDCLLKDEPDFIIKFISSIHERSTYEKLAKEKKFFDHIVSLATSIKKC
jgi:alpha-N-acetylglucosamine transferase